MTSTIKTAASYMAFAIISMPLFADPEYVNEPDLKTLTVTVADGDAADFDTAGYGACLTGNTVTNLVKKGGGSLALGSNDFSAYAGAFTVVSGTVSYVTAGALGSVNSPVYVKNGGTLECRGARNFALDSTAVKKIVFEGYGMDGTGALRAIGHQERGPFGKRLTMTGDASYTGDNICGTAYNTYLDMGGHTLTVSAAPGGRFLFSGIRLSNPGSIVMTNGICAVQNGIAWEGSSANVITANVATAELSSVPATASLPWTWVLGGNCKTFYVGENNGNDRFNPARNRWSGPIEILAPTLRVYANNSQAQYTTRSVSFGGKVSGGGISLEGDLSGNNPERGDTHLHLVSGDNDFTGGVSVAQASLHLWADGALPADGGKLVVTNGFVYLDSTNSTYSLPGLTVCGTGAVRNARGTWTGGIVKRGTGAFRNESWTATPSLVVEEGSYVLPKVGTGLKGYPLAGLIGGVRDVNYAGCNQTWVETTSVSLSPEAFYDTAHPYWKVAHDRKTVVYAGYLWNRGADATWTFAGASVMHYSMWLDGKKVIYRTDGNGNYCTQTNIEVTAGSHYIQLRVYATDNGGPSKDATNESGMEWKRRGFGWYDPLGRNSTDPADYRKLEDPGDGSLLTWALPDGDLPATFPGTDESFDVIPPIDSMTFAAGTSLDCSSNNYGTAELTGWPAISNCANFTISQSWRVDAVSVGSVQMTADGVLTFAAGSQLIVDEVSGRRPSAGYGEFAVCTATGGISGTPSLSAAKNWSLSVSADGKSILLACRPRGTAVVLK